MFWKYRNISNTYIFANVLYCVATKSSFSCTPKSVRTNKFHLFYSQTEIVHLFIHPLSHSSLYPSIIIITYVLCLKTCSVMDTPLSFNVFNSNWNQYWFCSNSSIY